MSSIDDRIPVPTNGHHALAAPVAEPPVEPALEDEDEAPRTIVTPGQATVVGFGIIAGLILLLLGRRRGRNG